MRFLPLIWKNMWRRKLRTVFTLLVIVVSFVLFGLLMTIRTAFMLGVELAGQDRLVVMHKVSIIQLLPVSYQGRVAAVPGVETVTHNTWFGGVYREPSNFFAQYAAEPESYLHIYPEIQLPDNQVKAWLADRQGAIVGVDTARRFGWKVGDRIPIQGTIWRPKSGTGDTWEFNLVGIYDAPQGFDKTMFIFRYDYLEENRTVGQGLVGWYIAKIADPAKSADMASRFDALFANSDAETRTTTERGFLEGFAKQIGDVGAIMVAILVVVLFVTLLVVTNTMIYAIGERTSELALLKTLGFTNVAVMALVMAESLALAVLGGAPGLWLAWAVVQAGDPTGGMLPAWILPTPALGVGAALMIGLGVVAGVVPAGNALRLRITDALRKP